VNLPGIIGERVFALFDTDRDGYLSKIEFIDGACRLFSSEFDENMKFVFAIIDFDRDGWISKDDIRTVLSHVPLSQVKKDSSEDLINKEGMITQKGEGK
jgi:Ca2+-binding EF-hand superfamily protein